MSDYLAVPGERVAAAHGRTSGEAEWAMVVPEDAAGPDEYLLTAACDHTDRALEAHGVAWSKQSAPDFLGDLAWRWGDLKDSFDPFRPRGWVSGPEGEHLIQDGSPQELLSPAYWIEQLGEAAVSYTHLDVYKRQSLNRSLCMFIRNFCPAAVILSLIHI